MKTIQTKPDCTLGFVKLEHLHLYMQFPEGAVAGWVPPVIIGGLSEITEEQAKELVYYDDYRIWFLRDSEKNFIPSDFHPYIPFVLDRSVLSLGKLAKKVVGIEEKDFDKYLVIKL